MDDEARERAESGTQGRVGPGSAAPGGGASRGDSLADASSIVARVAAARARRRWIVALESLSLGAAAAAVGAAALFLSLAAPSSASPWTLLSSALLCGAPMAATWWVEREKTGPAELARKLDGRLGANGTVAAAWELRARGDDGGLALALERRALVRVDAAALRRALPPPGWIWLAPPALGLALAALAPELSLTGASRGRAGVLPTPAPGAGWGADSAAGHAGEVARAAAALAQARGAAPGEPGAAELAARLTDAARTLAAGPDAGDDPAVGALREELLARAAELAAGAPPADTAPGDPGAGGAGAAPLDAGAAGEAADKLLTGIDPERRMVGSKRSTSAAEGPRSAPPGPESVAAEAGTLSGRWWSERHDPVVLAWRRTLAARAGR